MDEHHFWDTPRAAASHQPSDYPALLDLRGIFRFPESLPGKTLIPPRNHDALLIDHECLLVHTEAAVSLHHLPTQTMLWSIECPSFDFALHRGRSLLALAPHTGGEAESVQKQVIIDGIPVSLSLGNPAGSDQLCLWDLSTGQICQRFTERSPYQVSPRGLAFSPDGSLLVAGIEYGREYMMAFWDIATGRLLRTLSAENSDMTTFAFHPNGKILASGSFNHHKIWFWSFPTGELLYTWDYPEDVDDADRPYHLAFNREGTLLFAACGECGLRIWDMNQQQEIRGMNNRLYATCIAVAPDGKFLSLDGSLVEIGTWQVSHSFSGAFDAFSPDGRRLVTLDEFTSVAVWDRETHQLLYTVTNGVTRQETPSDG